MRFTVENNDFCFFRNTRLLKEAQGKSKEPKYALLYAAALSLDNQFKTVVDYLTENQQKLKDTPKYWMLLGNAYAKQSNYKDARKAFTEWRKLEPSQNSFVQSIQIEEIERDYLKAEQVIEEARLMALPLHQKSLLP